MQVLEKEKKIISIDIESNITESDKNKVLSAKKNYIKSWKSYWIKEAYNIWLTKLNF